VLAYVSNEIRARAPAGREFFDGVLPDFARQDLLARGRDQPASSIERSCPVAALET
jgi:hypothetical protein